MRALNHANIVSVFDIGKADNSYFIVMEFVDGTNLKKIDRNPPGRSDKPFPLKDAIYIGDGGVPRLELRSRVARR